MSQSAAASVLALRVKQWLPEWDRVRFDPELNQSPPPKYFFVFSMPARRLRELSQTYARDASKGGSRSEDLGIQRRLDKDRQAEISRFLRGGFPWSDVPEARRNAPDADALRKPGWLPTAIVVNIISPGEKRDGVALGNADAIRVVEEVGSSSVTLHLPGGKSATIPPLEVIDGQHRLSAFGYDKELDDFELPVVAFYGLDISWQAYLFWTINIKPKKINASLAFDLYPLLREQEWLESADPVHVYRETRAQELTEVLWATPSSPWYQRINMLGGPRKENGPVTQAAFVRSLTASMVKPWKSTRGPGGIFGGSAGTAGGIAWSRVQQAAFLLVAWRLLATAVKNSSAPWAEAVRSVDSELDLGDERMASQDAAFEGRFTLLATDQGVRGFQSVVNDICFVASVDVELSGWADTGDYESMTSTNVEAVAKTLESHAVYRLLEEIALGLATYDWRASSFPHFSDEQRLIKAALRGSGGYKEIRTQLVSHLAEVGTARLAKFAARLEK